MNSPTMTPACPQEIAFRLPGPLRDLRSLHQSVWTVMRANRDLQRGFIFAFAEHSGMIDIIVRSSNLPAHLQACAKPLALPSDTGDYRFALHANPVTRYIEPPGKTVTEALLNDDELIGWLRRQGNRHGFLARPASLSWTRLHRRCTPSHGSPYAINDVLFRGSLSITSPQRVQQALANGIGRSKAFGYGMLLLAPLLETAAG